MLSYVIRELLPSEIPVLEDFLYLAIFQRDETNPLPKSIIAEPALHVFIADFGQQDDHCLLAETTDGQIIGAVWARILAGEIKGFGYIDAATPEFAISIRKEYRNKGIGSELMRAMLARLKSKGYQQCSLAVQKDNYAFKMYQKLGFRVIGESEEEYIMLYRFD